MAVFLSREKAVMTVDFLSLVSPSSLLLQLVQLVQQETHLATNQESIHLTLPYQETNLLNYE
jgi:hypothetical protein